jgi:hypothetical protein
LNSTKRVFNALRFRNRPDPMIESLTDFVQILDSGSNSTLSVGHDGTGATYYGFTQIATLTGITGLTDEAALVSSGNLLAA